MRKTHDILISTHGCMWAADNLSNLLQKNKMSAAVIRKPRKCDLKIMVGWYIANHSEKEHRDELLQADKRVIWWVGTDILWLEAKKSGPMHPDIIWLNSHGIEHWAEWEQSAERLRKCGLKNVKVVHMPVRKRFRPMPLPEKFTVGCYCYDSRAHFYGEQLILQTAKQTPEMNWMIYPRRNGHRQGNVEYLSRVDDSEVGEKIYERQSAHLRIVQSDGMPQGPMEAMMAGRPVIYNFQPLPYAIHMPHMTAERLARELKRIRAEQKKGGGYNIEGAKYWYEKNDPARLIKRIRRMLECG